MKITVFGANGRVGREVIKNALGKGHQIVAYMRPERYLDDVSENLVCINAELNDLEQMKNAVSGSDAVIITLGGFFQPSLVEAFQNIIKILEETGPRRMIALMTPTVSCAGDKICWNTVFPKVWTNIFFRKGRANVRLCGEYVKNSNLDWTVVRYMEPIDGPYTGGAKVRFHVKQKITRADLADFMVDQAEDTQYIHQMPIVGS